MMVLNTNQSIRNWLMNTYLCCHSKGFYISWVCCLDNHYWVWVYYVLSKNMKEIMVLFWERKWKQCYNIFSLFMLQKGCKFIRCFCKCVKFGLLHSWHQYRMYTYCHRLSNICYKVYLIRSTQPMNPSFWMECTQQRRN
jgi:hypothetical protein